MLTCSICIESLLENIVCIQECGHLFHLPCIRVWFKKNHTCPTCRHVGNTLVKIFLNETERSPTDYKSDSESLNPEILLEKMHFLQNKLETTELQFHKALGEKLELVDSLKDLQASYEKNRRELKSVQLKNESFQVVF
uniref:ERAD-associated E3 ubiquitin-protein ligase HRD1 (Trinotate prediction) n=1 Tax=Myxobolus squamalis TaxID=59785 RepID=A0A6B2G2Z5_MYXSQ